MSEWTPGSNQFEDDTDGRQRRPAPIPLPRIGMRPLAPQAERPVVLFDRMFDREVGVSPPQAVQPAEAPAPAPVAPAEAPAPLVSAASPNVAPGAVISWTAEHRPPVAETPPPLQSRPEAPAPMIRPEMPVLHAEEQPQEPDPFAHQTEQQPHHNIHSAWLKIGLDRNGRPVQQEYGRAFQEEVRQEQVGSQFTQQSQQPNDSSVQQTDGTYVTPAMPHDPQLSSGQVPADHSLPHGPQTPTESQHLLPKPQKQIVSDIANPWFWLMLAIIAIAFFGATLI